MKKSLALKIFEAFSIERWNDLIRPFHLSEMDKNAEKLVVAYVVAKYEENLGKKIDWEWMIFASLFDLLRKISLCDIKSPVQTLIKKEYPAEYTRLCKWIFRGYEDLIDDDGLYQKFGDYLDELSGSSLFSMNETEERKLTIKIFRASHKYSTLRELKMIKNANEKARYAEAEKELETQMAEFLDLKGIQLLLTRQKPFEFIIKVEQLRFQTRWNQTPRVPETSVLGHCFFVAILTLLLGFECEKKSGVKFCSKRMYNNFFSALFHDLPESVTRDIISPVKQATEGLGEIIKSIEDKIVSKELVPVMEEFYRNEVLYFTSDEFSNRIMLNGCPIHCSFDEINQKYNSDEFSPVDGEMVRIADHFSAFLEADFSIRYGITSPHLEEGRANLINSYSKKTSLSGIDCSRLFSVDD